MKKFTINVEPLGVLLLLLLLLLLIRDFTASVASDRRPLLLLFLSMP